jgi:hypothetical protein
MESGMAGPVAPEQVRIAGLQRNNFRAGVVKPSSKLPTVQVVLRHQFFNDVRHDEPPVRSPIRAQDQLTGYSRTDIRDDYRHDHRHNAAIVVKPQRFPMFTGPDQDPDGTLDVLITCP